ncbi:MAG: hypothetical protein M3279_05290 [Actinomycetota bacterium]|nr:hypothetical protein [Actinomycetota bacterium]
MIARRRLAAAGCGLACALFAAGVSVARVERAAPRIQPAEGRGSAVVLGGRNVIVGSTTAAVPVRLPASARVDLDVEGNGRIVGLALLGDPYGSRPERGRFLFGGRAADCAAAGCEPGQTYQYLYDGSYDTPERPLLRAGRYVLYLIADGAPARVVLELDGLRGKVRIAPGKAEDVDLQTPATRFDRNGEGGTVWWAGSSFDAGEVGLTFSALYVKGPVLAGTTVEHCQYGVVSPPPAEVAYGPHCYSAASSLGAGYSFTVPADYSDDRFVVPFLSVYTDEGTTFPSDEAGLGFYVQSPHTLDGFGANALALKVR